MSDSSRSKARPPRAAKASRRGGAPASAPATERAATSVVRTAVAALVTVLGIAWLAVYLASARRGSWAGWATWAAGTS